MMKNDKKNLDIIRTELSSLSFLLDIKNLYYRDPYLINFDINEKTIYSGYLDNNFIDLINYLSIPINSENWLGQKGFISIYVDYSLNINGGYFSIKQQQFSTIKLKYSNNIDFDEEDTELLLDGLNKLNKSQSLQEKMRTYLDEMNTYRETSNKYKLSWDL